MAVATTFATDCRKGTSSFGKAPERVDVRAEYAKRTRAPWDDYDGPADDTMVQQEG